MGKMILIVFAGIISGCSAQKQTAEQAGQLFVQYAVDFQVPETNVFPEPAVLPEEIYEDATRLKLADQKMHVLAVSLILAKYHHFYIAHFRQGYSFVDPMELECATYMRPGNTRQYLVREFIEASGITPTSQDLLPSIVVMQWFSIHCDKNNPHQLKLMKAYLDDKDKSCVILNSFLKSNLDYASDGFNYELGLDMGQTLICPVNSGGSL